MLANRNVWLFREMTAGLDQRRSFALSVSMWFFDLLLLVAIRLANSSLSERLVMFQKDLQHIRPSVFPIADQPRRASKEEKAGAVRGPWLAGV